MKYCPHCGKEVEDKAGACPYCGCFVFSPGGQDVPSIGLNILAFVIPIIGLILYLVNRVKAPKKAAAIGKWALIGFGLRIILLWA